jgi:hypothetical protein
MGEAPDEAPQTGATHDEQLEHGEAGERAGEAAKPSDVGALDGTAAAGAASGAGTESGDEGVVPTSAPDPTIGPD